MALSPPMRVRGCAGTRAMAAPPFKRRSNMAGKMAVDATGTVYFTDGIDSVIRRITVRRYHLNVRRKWPTATVANNGNNGPATKAN